jgi:putrescine transport system permease protein
MKNKLFSINVSKLLCVATPLMWLVIFFLVPFLIVARISISHTQSAVPPYSPHWDGLEKIWVFISSLDLDNYHLLLNDSLYISAYMSSLWLAAITTITCLIFAYPMAYAISKMTKKFQYIFMTLIILPFWTSFLIRVYAWIGILKPDGFLDQVLLKLGLISSSLHILDSNVAIIIGMTYAYLPFMVFPIYASLEQLDKSLLEAANDLGAPGWKAFITITLPLTKSGIIAGCLSVFIPAIGEFVVPDLLGGPDNIMIGKVLWTEFFSNRDWPVASAVAVVLLLFISIPMVVYGRNSRTTP